MIVLLLVAASLALAPVIIASREEIRNGRLFDVTLAPSCKNKQPLCEPWQRNWADAVKMQPGDVVTREGLILRELRND